MAQGSRERTSGGTSSVGEATERAKGAAREVGSAARDVASTRAQTFFETSRSAAMSRIDAIANALRSASSQMEGEQAGLAQAARRAADGVERFSHSMRDRDLGSMLDVAQDYARRQPAMFLGGAFATGLLLARFLKSSSRRADAERYVGGTPGTPSYEGPPYVEPAIAPSPAATGSVPAAPLA